MKTKLSNEQKVEIYTPPVFKVMNIKTEQNILSTASAQTNGLDDFEGVNW